MTDASSPGPPHVSDRLRSVALALEIPLGVFGFHRFYVGKVGTGILMLCTGGGLGLWWLYDLILIWSGEFQDSEGRRVALWSHDSTEPKSRSGDARLPEDIDGMQTEIHELAERVDFLERMLSQVRDRTQVSPGRTGADG
jgi:hypothetical protein